MSKNILVCCAHPDDEVLGCGGTIARHVAEGDKVTVAWVADGWSSRVGGSPEERDLIAVQRRKSAEEALRILGAEPLYIRNIDGFFYMDQRLDSYPFLDIVQSIEGQLLANKIAPQIIYTHHLGDLNADHRITAQAVLTAFRPVPGSSVEAIYSFEVPSSTEWGLEAFVPDTFVHIEHEQLNAKFRALEAYDVEMREFPHPRSKEAIRALMQWRGASSGLPVAEAFKTLRRIEG